MFSSANLSFDDLYVFCKVIDCGGFHAAAEQLDISEPAVSQKIKKVEKSAGSYLIERGRKICLTESGTVFYSFAKQALQNLTQTREKIARLETGAAGKITIAAATSVSKYLLPVVCGKMHVKHPDAEFVILTCTSQSAFQKVLEEAADFGFTIQESVPSNELRDCIITMNREIIVARPGHSLSRQKQISPGDLKNWNFVISAPLNRYRQIKAGFLETTGIELGKSNIVIEDFDMAKRYTAENDVLLIGPAFSFAEDFAHKKLVALDLAGNHYYSKIRLIQRKDKVLTALHTEFIRCATNVFREMVQ